ncbi:sensor histidine kinase [Rhodohalobacter sulfatireducens]|uniref:histidine kinase n=1 Tax=Rhodohalobacter sulfatireducens TaxID=2911366 RepID=A0ABS9KGD4_9BACT|nr:HAMP domain-containing sensor histidine kinase [Rhodohalobacter sulfatireducens]MCG2589916.1 ATP-binding protein [Rhodohalobacter sulfatireducens]
MSWLAKYSTGISLTVLVILLVAYRFFEASNISGSSDTRADVEQKIAQSLDQGVTFFYELSEEFQYKSDQIYRDVNNAIQTETEKLALHTRLQQYDVWGIIVLNNNERWIWTGFDVSTPSDFNNFDSRSDTTAIVNFSNVVAFLNQRTINFNEEEYTVVTADKLYQISDLPFSDNRTSQLSGESILDNRYPIYFNLFGTTPPGATQRVLRTQFSDSVGTIYADPNQGYNIQDTDHSSIQAYRFSFHLAIFFLFFFTLFLWAYRNKNGAKYALAFIIVALSWLFIIYGGFISHWSSIIFSITSGIELRSIEELTYYAVNSLFIFLLFIALHNLLRLTQLPEWSNKLTRSFLLSILFGVIQVLLIVFFIESTQTLLTNSEIPLLDLELAPNAQSFFFYIFSALFFTGISGIIVTSGYHLELIESGKTGLIYVITSFSFFCTFFLLDLILTDFSIIDWVLVLAIILLFLHLICIHFLHTYPGLVKEMSGFRKLLIGVFFASSVIYVIIWNATNTRLDQTLLTQTSNFIEEESVQTEDVLYDLLSEIEYNLSSISEEDLNQRVANIQIQFQEVIQQSIRPDWQNYSFYVKLITQQDREIANYSTSVETPAWSTYFSSRAIMLRTYEGEQIRWHNNRPVIWNNLPMNLSDRIVSLSRGWIPLYDSENPREIIAWIAADVYLERADYNKPMRAVLSETPSDAWKHSFYLAEFTESRLTRNTMLGLYNHQPQYNRLPEREREIAESDSINFLTNSTLNGTFREVLINTDENIIVKASTPFPGMEQHLFSYFRLQIVLVFFGLFCFSILSLSGFQHFSPFGQSRRFRSRLIDGLAFATIIFLIVLTFTTQYAVGIQNEEKLERELIQNLNNLSESLKNFPVSDSNDAPPITLTNLTSTFNADVILYRGTKVAESTTPQVFQQNLIPSILPYPVYDFIYNQQRSHYITTTKIGNEELLVGYQSLLNQNGQPTGVIAIPTFLQSPIYNEQLLETTSYLFVVYLFIFALFIAGSVVLSGRLTKPLSIIQAGLKKISRGDMRTKVPVTSRDEIGSLANAYNNMVERLEEAQRELVKAERESAWKEMAQQVAHEIKNPLTPMKLNLQHLQRQLERNPEKAFDLKPVIEKTANNIIGQIESLNKIASDFSKFAQPIQEPKERVDLSELLKSISDLYNNESSVKVNLQLPDKNIEIQAVKDELRRVLVNLMKNSVEACNEDQAIVEISLERNSKDVLMKITDNGSGIDAEDREKVFVPKFSTKSSGTGLGLAISKKIVEAHGGDIWFESKKGQGTTFFVKLPIN